LLLVGVEPGDRVVVSTLTFAATANAVKYVGAEPVFVDSDPDSWNMDPDLLAEELADANSRNRLPKAVIVVDLYGQCADYDRIESVCRQYSVPLIEDAAEALGASYRGKPAGSFGDLAVLSFNGNKIITTSGGGALLGHNQEHIARAKFLSTQARDPAPHYEHSEIGFNYRMSNLLAAVGRAQLQGLESKVARRREHNAAYLRAFEDWPGIEFLKEADGCTSSFWLTTLTVDPRLAGFDREQMRLALEAENIEARPVWKPMHLQPIFESSEVRGGAVSASLFENGLCLPSGSSLSDEDRGRTIAVIEALRSRVG
jgi:pyridoxal phosphate-dependent aminotransferase EpsN